MLFHDELSAHMRASAAPHHPDLIEVSKRPGAAFDRSEGRAWATSYPAQVNDTPDEPVWDEVMKVYFKRLGRRTKADLLDLLEAYRWEEFESFTSWVKRDILTELEITLRSHYDDAIRLHRTMTNFADTV